MTLTAKEQAARAGVLTASRMKPIMEGDPDGVMRLYREFIGAPTPDDIDAEAEISRKWAVRLGGATEALNLAWYEEKNKVILTQRNTLVKSKDNEAWGATLDAWDPNLSCPVECKHVGGREPREIIVDRYQPQMQWQMHVTGAQQCALSVIKGADEPVVDYIPRHQPYIDVMVERAYAFLLCVALRTPPVITEAPPPTVTPFLTINMTGNNNFAHAAAIWLETYPTHKKFEDAKDIIKSLVPAEAVICFGYGIRVARARNGALTIRKDKDAQD